MYVNTTLNRYFGDIKSLIEIVPQCLYFSKVLLPIEVSYLLIRFTKTSFFPSNAKNTHKNGVNKQNIYTPNTQAKITQKQPLDFMRKI